MKKIIFILFLCIFLLIACFNGGDSSKERAVRAEKAKGDIFIGAVSPWKKDSGNGKLNWLGIELAVNEVNSKGGIMGRKIKIIKKDDEGSVNKGIDIAQEFADNLNITAVIGHEYSFITIPASVIYEYNGIVMVSPTASSPKLTQRNFKNIFRIITNDNDMGAQLADCAKNLGYKRMMIYYIKDEYGLGLANAFEKRAEEIGLHIFDRLSYDSTTKPKVFYRDFSKWKENYKFDAVFLAARNPERGANIIMEARKARVNVPFISGDGLNSRRFVEVGGASVENTIVPSSLNPNDKRKVVRDFIKKFKKKYGKMPDTWAALYYDAAKVLFYAIKKAGSTNPVKVRNVLHNTKNFEGVTGSITFSPNGDVIGKKLFFEMVSRGIY